MKRILTFLGTGKYQSSIYAHGDQTAQSRFASLALVQMETFDHLDVFLTRTVSDHQNWCDFREEAAKIVPLKEHPIPEGATEEELWEIFRQVCSVVQNGDDVTIDITHGFRSISAFATSIGHFLQSARQATVSGIYYGAYEARELPTGITPIFDLSSFLVLMRWTLAAESFEQTRNLNDLATLLGSHHREARKRYGPTGPTMLQKTSNHLRRIGDAWINMRSVEFSQHLHNLEESLNTDLQNEALKWAAPFFEVIERIRAAFTPYQALPLLALQRRLVEDYAASGNTLQAVTLAREWLISKVATDLGSSEVADPPYPDRETFEVFIKSYAKFTQGDIPKLAHFNNLGFTHLDSLEYPLAHIWSSLSDLRNDLDHCGCRSNARSVDNIYKHAQKIISILPPL